VDAERLHRQGRAPKALPSDDDVKKAVSANNKNAIGYINASSADETVKVVVK